RDAVESPNDGEVEPVSVLTAGRLFVEIDHDWRIKTEGYQTTDNDAHQCERVAPQALANGHRDTGEQGYGEDGEEHKLRNWRSGTGDHGFGGRASTLIPLVRVGVRPVT